MGTTDRTGRERERLRWRCRRGVKELDLVLERYLSERWGAASEPERAAFCRLLDCEDPELADLLWGGAPPGSPAVAALIERLRAGTGESAC